MRKLSLPKGLWTNLVAHLDADKIGSNTQISRKELRLVKRYASADDMSDDELAALSAAALLSVESGQYNDGRRMGQVDRLHLQIAKERASKKR